MLKEMQEEMDRLRAQGNRDDIRIRQLKVDIAAALDLLREMADRLNTKYAREEELYRRAQALLGIDGKETL